MVSETWAIFTFEEKDIRAAIVITSSFAVAVAADPERNFFMSIQKGYKEKLYYTYINLMLLTSSSGMLNQILRRKLKNHNTHQKIMVLRQTLEIILPSSVGSLLRKNFNRAAVGPFTNELNKDEKLDLQTLQEEKYWLTSTTSKVLIQTCEEFAADYHSVKVSVK